jgi:hypothetical protein
VLTETQNFPVPHLAFAEYLRLNTITPGHYLVTIETKDMVTLKATKQEAAFDVIP